MAKPSTAQASIHVVTAAIVYAVALVGVFQLVSLLRGGSGSLGEGVTELEAFAYVGALLILSGLLAMAVVLTPLALLFERQGIVHYSVIISTAAVAGCLPLIGLTWGPQGFGQGLESGIWFPDPVILFAFAGACGGLYLWLTWFRHLTARW
jgi:hypothetical protein